MGKQTAIAWTDHTFNPWWGCVKVSTECERCYAEKFSKRTGGDFWGPTAPRRFFGDKHWNEVAKWNREAAEAGVRRKVFCGSMCDVFERRPELVPVRARLWALIREMDYLDFLLVTKRPEEIAENLPALWGDGWRNVWLLVSAGTQSAWDERVKILRGIPAAVRGVSVEPMVSPIVPADGDRVDWIIVGGESGPKPRAMLVEWARPLRAHARRTGSAFFMKQLGGHPDKRDRLECFPPDLQIREWPTPARKPSHGDVAL